MRRNVVRFRNSQAQASSVFLNLLQFCLGNNVDSQKGESCNNQHVQKKRQRLEYVWHLWTELMRRSSKFAERTRLETQVFMVKWQSSVTPRFFTVRQGNRYTTYRYRVWEGKTERSGLSTRGYDHCFRLVVTQFKFVQCYPEFNITSTVVAQRGTGQGFDEGVHILEVRVVSV